MAEVTCEYSSTKKFTSFDFTFLSNTWKQDKDDWRLEIFVFQNTGRMRCMFPSHLEECKEDKMIFLHEHCTFRLTSDEQILCFVRDRMTIKNQDPGFDLTNPPPARDLARIAMVNKDVWSMSSTKVNSLVNAVWEGRYEPVWISSDEARVHLDVLILVRDAKKNFRLVALDTIKRDYNLKKEKDFYTKLLNHKAGFKYKKRNPVKIYYKADGSVDETKTAAFDPRPSRKSIRNPDNAMSSFFESEKKTWSSSAEECQAATDELMRMIKSGPLSPKENMKKFQEILNECAKEKPGLDDGDGGLPWQLFKKWALRTLKEEDVPKKVHLKSSKKKKVVNITNSKEAKVDSKLESKVDSKVVGSLNENDVIDAYEKELLRKMAERGEIFTGKDLEEQLEEQLLEQGASVIKKSVVTTNLDKLEEPIRNLIVEGLQQQQSGEEPTREELSLLNELMKKIDSAGESKLKRAVNEVMQGQSAECVTINGVDVTEECRAKDHPLLKKILEGSLEKRDVDEVVVSYTSHQVNATSATTTSVECTTVQKDAKTEKKASATTTATASKKVKNADPNLVDVKLKSPKDASKSICFNVAKCKLLTSKKRSRKYQKFIADLPDKYRRMSYEGPYYAKLLTSEGLLVPPTKEDLWNTNYSCLPEYMIQLFIQLYERNETPDDLPSSTVPEIEPSSQTTTTGLQYDPYDSDSESAVAEHCTLSDVDAKNRSYLDELLDFCEGQKML